MKLGGILLIVLGVGLMAWGLMMDTTVTSYGNVYSPTSEVSNLSLMQAQSNLLIVGATAFIGGILLYGFAALLRK